MSLADVDPALVEVDDLAAALNTGAAPLPIWHELTMRVEAAERVSRWVAMSKDQADLLAAWERDHPPGDWSHLERWLRPDGAQLTPTATRSLLDAWAIEQRASQ